MDEIKNVAIYTRVSTEEQSEHGFSLESQKERLRSYCEARGWVIYQIYTDAGKSGRNTTRRPAYQKMLNDIDKWDGILVIKMDRIHRNQKNFTTMMQQLRKKDKEFISMSESLDTSTAMGRFVMDIISRIAQLESEQTGERVFIGMKQKANQDGSGYIGGRVPYGYRMDKSNPRKHKIVEVPKELEIVKQAFQLYADGFSFRQIGKKLNKSDTTIRYYLNNVFYAGFERWTNIFKPNDYIEPLIDIELWNDCQIKMRSRCRSHSYDPIIIKERSKAFTLNKKETKCIPIINRAKHNLAY